MRRLLYSGFKYGVLVLIATLASMFSHSYRLEGCCQFLVQLFSADDAERRNGKWSLLSSGRVTLCIRTLTAGRTRSLLLVLHFVILEGRRDGCNELLG